MFFLKQVSLDECLTSSNDPGTLN